MRSRAMSASEHPPTLAPLAAPGGLVSRSGRPFPTDMTTLEVGLADRAYPIRIGEGLLSNAGELLRAKAGQRFVIVTNAIIAAHHLAPLKASLRERGAHVDVVLLPDGEAHKNQKTLDDLLTRMLEALEQWSTMLVAVGGVVGDIAGFAAAIYQRGIPFVQIPT